MWSSRLWFFILAALTSTLISGAFHTSPQQTRGERVARELELLIERKVSEFTLESIQLTTQPEVMIALRAQYEDPQGQQRHLSELLQEKLTQTSAVRDVLILDEKLSKVCPEGGGDCQYQPLLPWTKSALSVSEVIEQFNREATPRIYPMLDKAFSVSSAWVGDDLHIVTATPIISRNILGVTLSRGATIRDYIREASSELTRRWGDSGELSVYLGDQLILGPEISASSPDPAPAPSLRSSARPIKAYFTAQHSLFVQAQLLSQRGLATGSALVFTGGMTLAWLLVGLLLVRSRPRVHVTEPATGLGTPDPDATSSVTISNAQVIDAGGEAPEGDITRLESASAIGADHPDNLNSEAREAREAREAAMSDEQRPLPTIRDDSAEGAAERS